MKDNKTLFNKDELNHLETEYFNKRELFFTKNKNKTEVHFIKSELKIIENSEKEKNDLFKSNDNDFYDFLINNDHFKYKRILEESKNKEETKRQILENHLQRERQNFAPSEINNINKRKEFYKIKLETIQRNIKQVKENKKVLEWKGNTLQFAELVKALIESNLISPELSQKDIFELMREAFNIEHFDEGDKNKQIRNRTKTLTPLINTLEINLTNWIEKKDSI